MDRRRHGEVDHPDVRRVGSEVGQQAVQALEVLVLRRRRRGPSRQNERGLGQHHDVWHLSPRIGGRAPPCASAARSTTAAILVRVPSGRHRFRPPVPCAPTYSPIGPHSGVPSEGPAARRPPLRVWQNVMAAVDVDAVDEMGAIWPLTTPQPMTAPSSTRTPTGAPTASKPGSMVHAVESPTSKDSVRRFGGWSSDPFPSGSRVPVWSEPGTHRPSRDRPDRGLRASPASCMWISTVATVRLDTIRHPPKGQTCPPLGDEEGAVADRVLDQQIGDDRQAQ